MTCSTTALLVLKVKTYNLSYCVNRSSNIFMKKTIEYKRNLSTAQNGFSYKMTKMQIRHSCIHTTMWLSWSRCTGHLELAQFPVTARRRSGVREPQCVSTSDRKGALGGPQSARELEVTLYTQREGATRGRSGVCKTPYCFSASDREGALGGPRSRRELEVTPYTQREATSEGGSQLWTRAMVTHYLSRNREGKWTNKIFFNSASQSEIRIPIFH